MKSIEQKNKVSNNDLSDYESIDGYRVMEELLRFKGTKIIEGTSGFVNKKILDDMALVVYGLKVNPTNRLYVGFYLDRFYRRENLVADSGRVKIPMKIFDKIKEETA